MRIQNCLADVFAENAAVVVLFDKMIPEPPLQSIRRCMRADADNPVAVMITLAALKNDVDPVAEGDGVYLLPRIAWHCVEQGM